MKTKTYKNKKGDWELEVNTTNMKLDWKSDDRAKLKALKRLLKEFDNKIQDKHWDHFYMVANNIINNHNYKK